MYDSRARGLARAFPPRRNRSRRQALGERTLLASSRRKSPDCLQTRDRTSRRVRVSEIGARNSREQFDLAILFQNAFHAAWTARLARIPVRIGYATDGRSALLTDAIEPPSPAAYGHQVYYYLNLSSAPGLTGKPEAVEEMDSISPTTEKPGRSRNWIRSVSAARDFDRNRSRRRLRSRQALAARAFRRARRPPDWSPGRRCAHLRFRGREAARRRDCHAMKHTPIVLAGETSLRELLSLMAGCRLMVANDSGPMHLAAAMGIPLIAIFGSTDERATGPLGTRVRIVRKARRVQPLRPPRVPHRLPLHERPCGRRGLSRDA